MTIENLQLKIEQQSKLIADLTAENEQLYQQYNHLMVRNNKMLKRIDDLQQIISDLHLRIEELQLVNHNMLKLNDNLRQDSRNPEQPNANNGEMKTLIDKLHHRVEELHLRTEIAHLRSGLHHTMAHLPSAFESTKIDLNNLYERWRNFPGQQAKNAPNLRKQAQMLAHLYESGKLRATELFTKTGINGVTGARYVATLKKFNLIEYIGARKKGQYSITETGKQLIESNATHSVPNIQSKEVAQPLINENIRKDDSGNSITNHGLPVDTSSIEAINIARTNEFKSVVSSSVKSPQSHFEHSDL